ncbi:MAG TPA: ribosome silencing factor [Pseudomonadales bacterium]|nr:ribosome silencing factor [Pseudomonadales bacterium]
MTPETLRDLVVAALDDLKGQDILALDVSGASSFTDWMVIASGTSSRHVKSLVDNVTEHARAEGAQLLGVEGQDAMEWILVDLGDVVVHVMQPETRHFYDLERLWNLPAVAASESGAPALAPLR